MMSDTMVTLEDELGETINYEAIDVFDLGGRDYIVLEPQDAEVGDLLIMHLEEDGDTLSLIVDDEEWVKVLRHYHQLD